MFVDTHRQADPVAYQGQPQQELVVQQPLDELAVVETHVLEARIAVCATVAIDECRRS